MSKSTMIELVEELEKIKEAVPCEEIDYMIKEARGGEYSDYKNKKYTCGKMGFVAVADAFSKRNPELLPHLTPLSEAIKNGEYDETADDIDNMKMTNEIMKDTSMNTKQKEGLLNMIGLKKKTGKSPYGKRYF